MPMWFSVLTLGLFCSWVMSQRLLDQAQVSVLQSRRGTLETDRPRLERGNLFEQDFLTGRLRVEPDDEVPVAVGCDRNHSGHPGNPQLHAIVDRIPEAHFNYFSSAGELRRYVPDRVVNQQLAVVDHRHFLADLGHLCE